MQEHIIGPSIIWTYSADILSSSLHHDRHICTHSLFRQSFHLGMPSRSFSIDSVYTAQWKINSISWSNLICITCNHSAEVCCASHSLFHLPTDSDWGHLVWEVQGFWELQYMLPPGAELALDTAVLSLQSICLLLEGPERHACDSEAAPGPCTLPLSSWWTHPLECHGSSSAQPAMLWPAVSAQPALWSSYQTTLPMTQSPATHNYIHKQVVSKSDTITCLLHASHAVPEWTAAVHMASSRSLPAVWYTHIWEVEYTTTYMNGCGYSEALMHCISYVLSIHWV